VSAQAYLAIDLGAESGRAIVGVLDGHKLTLHEAHRFFHMPRRLPSGLHWDLMGLWGNILEGTQKAVTWCKKNSTPLVSLGVDTWGVDWALVSRSGELTFLPHAYRDERNNAAYEKTLATIGRQALYEATGTQFMPLNTLFQLVAQYDAAPGTVTEATDLLFMPDLFHFFFTGRRVVEFSIASTSQMLDARTGKWAKKILEAIDLPTQMLGEISPSGTVVGPVLRHIGEELGAEPGLKVITPAAHDTACAVAAVPASDSSWCYISSGTWSLMGAELDKPCLSVAAREAPFTNEGGVDGTIRFLKNLAGLWLVQECRRQWQRQGREYDYATLTDLAAEAEPFRTLVDTDHAPFAAPGDMPGKIAAFARRTHQPEPQTPGQFVRTCLESLALTYRRTLEKLESVLGRRFEVIHIVGGGGRNHLLNQMTADATGRRVVVGPYEATAAGNILVQAMGAGNVKDLTHLRKIVAAAFEPQTFVTSKDTDAWDDAFTRFVSLIDR